MLNIRYLLYIIVLYSMWRRGETTGQKVKVEKNTRNEMGLKLGLKPLFSWFSAVSGGFRGDLDPKTRNLDPA